MKNEQWSKRIWYVAALIAVLTLMTENIVAILVLNIISIIIIAIISFLLKRKESNVLIQPSLSSDQTPDAHIQEYVTIYGVQYRVRSKSLELTNKGIKDLSDIEGLDKLWYLKKLDLSDNQLTHMKGLESLINLRVLKLSNNQIQNLENISSLNNLQIILLDNNQLKELRQSDLPHNSILKKIDISKNPIEKFDIYMIYIYNAIKFGPKKWFPKQELKRLNKQVKRMKGKASIKMYSLKEGLVKFLIVFSVWAALTFVLALLINLPFWGVITSSTGLEIGYWEFLFTQGLWTFLVGGIGAVVIIVLVAQGDFP